MLGAAPRREIVEPRARCVGRYGKVKARPEPVAARGCKCPPQCDLKAKTPRTRLPPLSSGVDIGDANGDSGVILERGNAARIGSHSFVAPLAAP